MAPDVVVTTEADGALSARLTDSQVYDGASL
jgi:hypothetical protein